MLSAINQTHVPLSSESISILSLPQPLAAKTNDVPDCAGSTQANTQRYLASFEIFKPYKPLTVDIGGPPESYINRDVIVLWLPEEELGTEILRNYTGLLRYLYPGTIIPQNSLLLGPISSAIVQAAPGTSGPQQDSHLRSGFASGSVSARWSR